MCSCCPMCRWWYTCTGKLLEPITQHVLNTLIRDRFRNVDGTYACTAFHVLAGRILLCINSIRHGHICIHLASTWKKCMHGCQQQFQNCESWTGKLEFGSQVVGAGPATLSCCHLLASVLCFPSCRDGFCRFSSSRYTLDKTNLKNLYMHLTNVAIQKKNDKYDENTGMKWPISKLKQYLLSKHGLAATSKLFGDIQVSMLLEPRV